jgi:formyltetrahydrofolate deformylase
MADSMALSSSGAAAVAHATSGSSTTATSGQQDGAIQYRPQAQATAINEDHILTLSCPDKPGLVHAITGLLSEHNLNILDLQQFADPETRKFFMRVHFGPFDTQEKAEEEAASSSTPRNSPDISEPLQSLAQRFSFYEGWSLRPLSQRPRVLIMVSKIGHCLNDLLFRARTNRLPITIVGIVSNHPDFSALASSYDIPFHHYPVTAATKQDQESRVLSLCAELNVDLIVLARYMQILSPTLCTAMSGRIINIHHSFLPSFIGAKPYHAAYARGVKIIGATAHFVTQDLDEGPIIEQRVVRVNHTMGPKELVEQGADVECSVLASAVKWWAERRVFLNGGRTVVFA